jgi:hypothetical protein
MDFLKSSLSNATTGQTTGNPDSAIGNDNQNQQSSAVASNEQQAQAQGGGGGLFDSFKNQANNAMGGGAQGEAKGELVVRAHLFLPPHADVVSLYSLPFRFRGLLGQGGWMYLL